MSGNKQVGRIGGKKLRHPAVVMTGITADMRHQHVGLLTPETQQGLIKPTYIIAVDIAAHGPERPECGQTFGQPRGADVAGMPYFLTWGKILQIAVVPTTVGVRKQSDTGHNNTE